MTVVVVSNSQNTTVQSHMLHLHQVHGRHRSITIVLPDITGRVQKKERKYSRIITTGQDNTRTMANVVGVDTFTEDIIDTILDFEIPILQMPTSTLDIMKSISFSTPPQHPILLALFALLIN